MRLAFDFVKEDGILERFIKEKEEQWHFVWPRFTCFQFFIQLFFDRSNFQVTVVTDLCLDSSCSCLSPQKSSIRQQEHFLPRKRSGTIVGRQMQQQGTPRQNNGANKNDTGSPISFLFWSASLKLYKDADRDITKMRFC